MPGGQPADALLYDQNVLDWAFVGERVGDHDFVSRGFTKNMRVLSPYEKLQIIWNDTVAAGAPTATGPPARRRRRRHRAHRPSLTRASQRARPPRWVCPASPTFLGTRCDRWS